ESRLFRANGNAARKEGKQCRWSSEVASLGGTEVEPRSRNEVVQKVVDELRNTVHNLASLLLKTQRC
ncbi:enoyl-CoA hydratase, partial [Burkholderia cenocepacia]|uniref:enoyl-CoA hydratase n=2 Tax=Burkholderia cenocepacia TaxID=95486 RepID=UPI001C4E2752